MFLPLTVFKAVRSLELAYYIYLKALECRKKRDLWTFCLSGVSFSVDESNEFIEATSDPIEATGVAS